MSGILPGIPLVNNFDENGEVMRGALLRVYAAGTTTPAQLYKDSALTSGQEHPWPLEANSAGRLPMFWVADGVYRARLSSADGGYVAYDIPAIEAVGASSDEGGGGGGGSGVSSEVIFQTGDPLWKPSTGTRPGWVRMNGRTIGSASSGATERAAADTQALYEWYWNNFDNTTAPVTGGRGASATADFAANKPIQLFDMRLRGAFGLDTMGNTSSGRATDTSFATPTVAGSTGGAAQRAIAEANLPAIKPTITTTNPAISPVDVSNTSSFSFRGVSAGGDFAALVNSNLGTGATFGQTAQITPNVSAAFANNLGSGTALNNMPPGMLGTFYQKL